MDKCNHVHLGYCAICAEVQIATLTSDLEAARQLNKAYEAELADYGDTVTRLRHDLAECKEKLEIDNLDFKGQIGGEE